MGGSLLELLAIGEQDTHLIGNPKFSYFKKVYKTHTNFSIEPIAQYFLETPDFGKKVVCPIDRKGDLLSQIFLELELPALQANVSWINGIGNHIIKDVELEIGGVSICKISGEFLDIYSEMTTTESKRSAYYKMVGKFSSFSRNSQTGALHLFVPLPFWFCKTIYCSLPLVSMQYSQVRVNLTFRPFNETWYSGTAMSITPSAKNITNAKLYCDYIFLDAHERTKMANMDTQDFLIEQLQKIEGNTINANVSHTNLHFKLNHPVKELIWIYQANSVRDTNDWGNFSMTLDDDTLIQTQTAPLTYCTLLNNNLERFERRNANYFRYVIPWQRHLSINPDDFIYVYSFALFPENHQPSGTCNFSKLESNTLQLEFVSGIPTGDLRIYAINYNVIRIKNGMTGLLYSS